MKLLVLVPAYNEEKFIGRVIESIPKQIQGVKETETLVIDDGSTDGTSKIAEDKGAMVVRNHLNLGLGASFDRGLQYAIEHGFDILVTIDADMQFDAKDIPRIIKPILEDSADFVTGSRFIDKSFHPSMPLFKFLGNKFMAGFISRLSRQKFYDVTCGFRAYSKQAMFSLNIQGEFNFSQEAFLSLLLKRMRAVEIPVQVVYFKERRSKVASNLFIYGFNTLKIILRTYRDYKPLRFFMSLSLIFFSIGIFFEGILFWTFFTRDSFYPNIWSGFVGGAFLFTAIIFFSIGILADMNTRSRLNQEKILYYVRKLIANENK